MSSNRKRPADRNTDSQRKKKDETQKQQDHVVENEDEDLEEFEAGVESEEEMGEIIEDNEDEEGLQALEEYEEDEKMEEDEEEIKKAPKKAFRPGIDRLQEGEVLDFDASVYEMLYRLNVEWPCLSFDILRDPLGIGRSKFPHTMYFVTGTQAEKSSQNNIMVSKISHLHKTKHEEKENDSDSSDSDDENFDDEPVIENKTLNHKGAVNRIRSMPQCPHIVANWSETGEVHVWNLKEVIESLDTPMIHNTKGPIFTYSGHKVEGFAIDWSPLIQGRLATGDLNHKIQVWNPSAGSTVLNWQISTPYSSHQGSIEDIQWSPTEQNVLASCSSDKTIKVWDTRMPKAALSVQGHDDDINVLSWNKTVTYLMLSGCEDGSFKIWDLRNFQPTTPAAHFKWHNSAITSVEWHPTEEALLAVSSADQLTIWDLSLEKDTEAEEETGQLEDEFNQVPPQLLFVHQGQNNIKELHWHPQIPGAIVSTAESGFNVFKTFNV